MPNIIPRPASVYEEGGRDLGIRIYSETRLKRTASDRPNLFVITGSICVVNVHLGPEYSFVITELHCTYIRMLGYRITKGSGLGTWIPRPKCAFN